MQNLAAKFLIAAMLLLAGSCIAGDEVIKVNTRGLSVSPYIIPVERSPVAIPQVFLLDVGICGACPTSGEEGSDDE